MMESRTQFGQLLRSHNLYGIGAEVGTRYGLFAKQIGKYWDGRIVCVDLWTDEEIFEVAQTLLADKKFHLYRDDSQTVAKVFADGELDWVYIDADHRYDSVKTDLAAWFPKVRKGGVVAGHDYVQYKDWGVVQAVDEFAAEHGYKINVTTKDDWKGLSFPTWWFIK